MNPAKKCVHGINECAVCEANRVLESTQMYQQTVINSVRELISAVHRKPIYEELLRHAQDVSFTLSVMEHNVQTRVSLDYKRVVEQAKTLVS